MYVGEPVYCQSINMSQECDSS